MAYCSPILDRAAVFLGVTCTGLLLEGISTTLQNAHFYDKSEEGKIVVYILRWPDMILLGASDPSIAISNFSSKDDSQSVEIIATESSNWLVSFSSKILNASAFPDGTVLRDSGYFVQSLTFVAYNLDWR